jgi:hypothetical protein
MKTTLKRYLLPVIYGILAAILLLALLPLTTPVNAQESGTECWAVIVGIEDYIVWSDRTFGDNDAQGLADTLSPVWGEDHINLLLNSSATKRNIEDAMTDWLASRVGEGDLVLFYWAGWVMDDTGYLNCYNSQISNRTNDISGEELNGWLDDLAESKMVIIGVGAGKVFDEVSGFDRIVISQSDAGEGFWVSSGFQQSVFTHYLLEAIDEFETVDSNNDLELTVEEVFAYASTRTSDWADNQSYGILPQTPQISDRYSGELSLLFKATIDVDIDYTATGVLEIDGTSYSTASLPVTFTWAPGSNHIVQVNTPISGKSGERYVFDTWDGGIQSTSRTISHGGTYTVIYKTQYYLTVESTYGDPQGEGWYDSGSAATISITTPVEQGETKRIFEEWTGDYSGTSESASIVMNQPKAVTATWRTQYYLTVTSIYGNPQGTGWYDSDSSAEISIESLVEETGTKHHFDKWSGDFTGTSTSSSVVMDQPKSVTAEWWTEYYLTVNSEYGEPEGEGWYNSGTTAEISVTTPVGMIIRQVFTEWSGDYSGDTASSSIIMDKPKTVTAGWTTDLLQLYILIIVVVVVLGGGTFLIIRLRRR